MVDTSNLKKIGYSMLGFIAIVLFFDGIYNGIGELPIITFWYVSLVIGLTMLATSGYMWKLSATFETIEEITTNVLKEIHTHPEKHEFHIIYDDKIANKKIPIHAIKVKRIENGFLVIEGEQNHELFIPLSRISHTLYKGQPHWLKHQAAKNEDDDK